MYTSSDPQKSITNNSLWFFLAEYSLSEFVPSQDPGDELTAELLPQMMRELGIPLKYIKNIDMTLTGFAKEALVHFKQGSLELPGRIRVFCQKKLIDEANSTKTPRLSHGESIPIKCPPGTILNGGWGYFIIERSGGDDYPWVDLYLYQE